MRESYSVAHCQLFLSLRVASGDFRADRLRHSALAISAASASAASAFPAAAFAVTVFPLRRRCCCCCCCCRYPRTRPYSCLCVPVCVRVECAKFLAACRSPAAGCQTTLLSACACVECSTFLAACRSPAAGCQTALYREGRKRR